MTIHTTVHRNREKNQYSRRKWTRYIGVPCPDCGFVNIVPVENNIMRPWPCVICETNRKIQRAAELDATIRAATLGKLEVEQKAETK